MSEGQALMRVSGRYSSALFIEEVVLANQVADGFKKTIWKCQSWVGRFD